MSAESSILYNYTDVDGGIRGGGIYVSDGTVDLSGVDIEHNGSSRGGGFYSLHGDLTLYDCILANNTADLGPGGCYSLAYTNTLTIAGEGGCILDDIEADI